MTGNYLVSIRLAIRLGQRCNDILGIFATSINSFPSLEQVPSSALKPICPTTDPHSDTWRITMFDEMERLRSSPHLLQLLSHYAHLGAEKRETWQNRLMTLEGVEPPELVKLHGWLIAFGWADQNTGHVPICYRITLAGLRAMRRVQISEEEEDELPGVSERGLQKAA